MGLREIMGILGIDTVAIVVSDRHSAIRWYRDVLGLDVAYIGPREANADPSIQGTAEDAGHWIEMGPRHPKTRVHICQMDATEPGPTGITFLTDEIAADYERMRGKGVDFPMPPEKMEWGEWLAQFVDPDGNVFDLKQPIPVEEWGPTPIAAKRRTRARIRRAPRSPAGRGRGRGPRTKRPRRSGRAS
jgi:uncharacterized glyoxalase superfamily protein PhnB